MKCCRVLVLLVGLVVVVCEKGSATRKPLFRMPYWHDRTKRPTRIAFFEGDDPIDVATRFCDDNSLGDDHYSTILSELQRRVTKLQTTEAQTHAAASRPVVSSIDTSRIGGTLGLGKLLFQISFGVKGGARKVDVYENESIEAAADRFGLQHSLDIEHRKTLVRLLEKQMGAHIAESAPVTQQESSKQSKRRPQRQPQRKPKRQPQPQPQRRQRQPKSAPQLAAVGQASVVADIEPTSNGQQHLPLARSPQTDELYVLPIHVNGNEHLVGVKKDVAIEKLASEFCEVLGISATDEFILHLSVVDGIKRHHAKMVKMLRLRQPVTPLKFHFSLPGH